MKRASVYDMPESPNDPAETPDAEPLSDDAIAALLQQYIEDAMNGEDGDLSSAREKWLNAYRGDPQGDERDGHSKHVTREVFEVIEELHPQILRPFVVNDRPVEFTPEGPEDEAEARRDSDVVNYHLTRKNNAFDTLSTWIKDMLINHNAYTKMWMEERTKTVTEEYAGLMTSELGMLLQAEGVEAVEQETRVVMVQPPPPPGPPGVFGPPPEMPPPQPMEVYDVTIERTEKKRELRWAPVPPEQMLIDNGLTTLNLDDARFLAHKIPRTKTDLRELGVDEKILDELESTREESSGSERINRMTSEDEEPFSRRTPLDPSMDEVWIHECYVQMDKEGTGIARRYQVTLAGSTVLECKPTDYQPFLALSTIGMPHRHVGMSMAEVTSSLQRVSTQLTRQMVDNSVKLNVGKTVISDRGCLEGNQTLTQLMDATSEFVKVKGRPSDVLMPLPQESQLQHLLPLMQHFQQKKQLRTGVSPEQNLDPAVLQRVAAEPLMEAQTRSSARNEMLVRRVAECGVVPAMLKAHQLLRMYPDKPLRMKLRGEWVETDPSGWRERVNVEVRVGLGFHNRERQLQFLLSLFQLQQEVAPKGLVTPAHTYNLLRRIIEMADIGDIARYFDDPTRAGWQPPPPPPPDPLTLAQAQHLQAQSKNLEDDNQRGLQELQINTQIEQAKIQSKAQADQMRAQADMQKAQLEGQLRAAETRLKEMDAQVRVRELDLQLAETQAKIRNTDADTLLKHTQAEKTLADAEEGGNPLVTIPAPE